MKQEVPLIFVGKGLQPYLKYALFQARHSNPDARIIVLGDSFNDHYPFVEHHCIYDYYTEAKEFPLLYKNKTQTEDNYLMFAAQRVIILAEFLERHDLKSCVLADTDIMLYADLNDFINAVQGYDIALHYDSNGDCAPIGFSYFTHNTLKAFSSFILTLLSNPEHLETCESLPNKIENEMEMARLFLNEKPQRICSLYNPLKGKIVDPNFCNSHGFILENGHKKISWKDGIPFAESINTHELVPFYILHFQGSLKALMSQYYTGPKIPLRYYLQDGIDWLQKKAYKRGIFRKHNPFVAIPRV